MPCRARTKVPSPTLIAKKKASQNALNACRATGSRRLRITESIAEVDGELVRGPTKTHATRTLPLPRSLAAELEAHLERTVRAEAEAPLFEGPRGGLLRYSTFAERVWRPTLRALDLPVVGVHALRHSAAARMIQADASTKAVQTVLGHSSAAFTLTVYGHIFEAELDDLAERLDSTRPTRGLRTGTDPEPVGRQGIEPWTSGLKVRCSTS